MNKIINKKTKQQGVNLLEILLTLAILSFLMGYALPSYQHIIERQSQTTELARLQSFFNFARLIASLKDESLQVCASNNGEQCDLEASKKGNLLILTTSNKQPLYFSPGTGYPIILPTHDLLIYPLPSQKFGGSLLPCTGFSRTQPKGITLSSTGRVRVNDKINANLVAKCPN